MTLAEIPLKGDDDETRAAEAIRHLDLGDNLIDSDVADVDVDLDLNQAMPAMPKIELPEIHIPKTKMDIGIDLNGSSDESSENSSSDEDDGDDGDDGEEEEEGEGGSHEGGVQSAKLAEDAKRKMQKFLNKKLASMKDLIDQKLNLLHRSF